ncbi:MAG: tRNA lysidine(34) synthetase TilS [Firmicutes bacterium]|nr:tRNA lysidine(34) synthetase TilS [Bacillota bacterium]
MADIAWEQYIRADSKILVAFSGGPDSMYLLYRLKTLRKSVPFLLEAAHLHHGLREEADADLSFVEAVCRKWDIPLVVERADVAAYAAEKRMSIEEAGRAMRYRFFRRHKRKGGMIALAHHLDDQVETMLLRLIRGTGLEGIGGMSVRDGDLFRPLLGMTKDDILSALNERKIPYVVDRTNEEAIYSRNKVRLRIIPAAKAINPGFVQVMESFRKMAVEDASYLEEVAEASYRELAGCDASGLYIEDALFDLSPSVKGRVLRKAIAEVRGNLTNISYDHIGSIDELKDAESGKGIDLPGIRVQRSYGKVYIRSVESSESAVDAVSPLETETVWNGHRFVLDEALEGDFIRIEDPSRVVVRARLPGDRIKLKVGHKKIKDIFIDEKIDRQRRDRWPLVVEDGEVIWVVGLRKAYRQEEDKWQKLVWVPSKKI